MSLPNPEPTPVPPASEPTEICAVSGKRYPRREMINYEGRWLAAEHKEAYFQRLREGVGAGEKMKYGGFWIRVGARLIDGIILAIVNGAVNLLVTLTLVRSFVTPGAPPSRAALLTFGVIYPINMALGVAYACFFVRKYDATPGKMACGLKLFRADGSKLSVGRIIGRVFADMVSAMTLCIGYMMAGWDDEKRALHDRICDTRVVRAR